jgi:hypothetical protein
MARGKSGRIVLEVDPSEKNALYDALKKEGLTLKEWFLRQSDLFLRQQGQLSLFASPTVAEDRPPYRAKRISTNQAVHRDNSSLAERSNPPQVGGKPRERR